MRFSLNKDKNRLFREDEQKNFGIEKTKNKQDDKKRDDLLCAGRSPLFCMAFMIFYNISMYAGGKAAAVRGCRAR